MNALGSPVESLAVDYLSYTLSTAINNVWAWVALITAVVGLWRIRTLSSSPPQLRTALKPSLSTVGPAAVPTRAAHVTRISATAPKSYCMMEESEGSPKRKFSAYYNYNDIIELRNINGSDAAVEREVLRWRRRVDDDWERRVAVRMGDMGWYNSLDFKVLDGSVVRLWDS